MPDEPPRPDNPSAGLFNHHADAISEADRRADLTRLRYRVYLDAANHWWCITETTKPVGAH